MGVAQLFQKHAPPAKKRFETSTFDSFVVSQWRLDQQVREAQRARVEDGNRRARKEPLQMATPSLSRLRGPVGDERRATKGGLRR